MSPSRYEDSAIMEAKHIEVAAAHREAATAGGHRGEVHRAAAKLHGKAAYDNRYNPNSADARATSDQARNATLRIGYAHSVRWPDSAPAENRHLAGRVSP